MRSLFFGQLELSPAGTTESLCGTTQNCSSMRQAKVEMRVVPEGLTAGLAAEETRKHLQTGVCGKTCLQCPSG